MNEPKKDLVISKEAENEFRELFCKIDYSMVDNISLVLPRDWTDKRGCFYYVSVDGIRFTIEKIGDGGEGTHYLVGSINDREVHVEWSENGYEHGSFGITVPAEVFEKVKSLFYEKYGTPVPSTDSSEVKALIGKLEGIVAVQKFHQQEIDCMNDSVSKIDFSKADYITKTVEELSDNRDEDIITYHVCIGGNILEFVRTIDPSGEGSLVYLESVNGDAVLPHLPASGRITLPKDTLETIERVYNARLACLDCDIVNTLANISKL